MKKTSLIILLWLFVSPFLWAQENENENEAVKTLRLLEKKYKEVTTFSGEFTQIKKSEVFLEEISSKGKYFYKKPRSFRCDYLSPNESENLFINDMAWVYVPELKQVEKYYVGSNDNPGKGVNQMLIGFGVSTDKLLKEYFITIKDNSEKIIGVSLIPKKNGENKQTKEVIVWINKEKITPDKFKIIENNGDVTEITMMNINVDVKLDENLFKPSFPKGVEIIEQE